MLNRTTQSAVRKLKDGQGAYLWQPSGQPGIPSTLMGFPVVEAEDMPDIATDSYAIAFGDFKRGYLIVDRVGIRVLRDPYLRQTLRAVLHDQARRWRHPGLRRAEAAEVRGVTSVPSLRPSRLRARAALIPSPRP